MPKAFIRVIDLKPNQMKALVFIEFRKNLEPLERELIFKIDKRNVYDEFLNDINSFFKIDVSFGIVNRIYTKNRELDILIGTNKLTL